jgi:Carboxypeptidase regulatory-like domain
MQRSATIALFFASVVASQAAVIHGLVVEKSTGYSVANAAVTLQPLPLAGQASTTVRSNESGRFEFGSLARGAYLVKAARRGFMPAEYGQKRWNSAGTAIIVDGDTTISIRVPLSRFGSITGTVRDSNEVGIPDQDVAAYTNTQPPHFITRATSDERGIFRIPGLDPGSYLVRTLGNNYEDRSYLPTFSRQTQRVEEARTVTVYPEEDANDGDVRPIPGRLFEISGATPLPASRYGFTMTVTLASDMGRVVSQGPAFHFKALAPVRYELYAEARENAPGTRVLGGYSELALERNLTNFSLPLNEVGGSGFNLEGAGEAVSAVALYRRKDLAGAGPVESVKLGARGVLPLPPGHWEFLIAPPSYGYYVSRFAPVSRDNTARPEGWNDILVGNLVFNRFTVTLSNGAGAIHGTVKISSDPAGAAPVFLEAWDPVTRQRVLDLRETRTDMRGNYRFDGLPPGDYRILSTFEYAAPDPNAFDAALARSLRVESSTDPQVDLDLYGIP